ncbi:MAG: outer membrane protein assembly factor BamD [Planctomycetes bacterium]|nr:outer membrane protein assembly factor BamD [Planctomycetota bacterium]
MKRVTAARSQYNGALMHRYLLGLLAFSGLAAGCADGLEVGAPEGAWQYRPSGGYVNLQTMELKSPEELFAHGLALHEAGKSPEAAAAFEALGDSAPDASLRSNASYWRGETLMKAGATLDAYHAFENYQTRYPDGEFSTRAKARMMECAMVMAKVGTTDTILGLPVITTSKTGIELLRHTLQRFPREDFSDDHYYRLAEFYYERGDLSEAELELNFILFDPTYKRSNSAPRALLLLGRIGLERYDGVDYDHKTLADAKRAYEQFELDYKRYLDDPQKAAELGLQDLPALMATARAGIAFVNERLAEREFMLAEYYARHGRPAAARVYLAGLLKNYPKTTWAARAAKLVQELEPTP